MFRSHTGPQSQCISMHTPTASAIHGMHDMPMRPIFESFDNYVLAQGDTLAKCQKQGSISFLGVHFCRVGWGADWILKSNLHNCCSNCMEVWSPLLSLSSPDSASTQPRQKRGTRLLSVSSGPTSIPLRLHRTTWAPHQEFPARLTCAQSRICKTMPIDGTSF